jgi:polyphosphate kinase 2 (PPK2 family)
LVARVHKLVPSKVWSERYRLINDFEHLLRVENNTTILKFYLHISKDEQLARFKKRLEDPARHWKISEADYTEREHWGEYQKAYADMLKHTSTTDAPWFIIPADQKWFRDLAIAEIITTTLIGMKMAAPQSHVDLNEIRKKYHQAVSQSDPHK